MLAMMLLFCMFFEPTTTTFKLYLNSCLRREKHSQTEVTNLVASAEGISFRPIVETG